MQHIYYLVAFCTLSLSSHMALAQVADLNTDIDWKTGSNSVLTIESNFNTARRGEEQQLSLVADSLGKLVLPTQSDWDKLSPEGKVLYLHNAERTARRLLPLAGVEEQIQKVAQDYTQLLNDSNTFGHYQPSGNSSQDSPYIRIDNNAQIGIKSKTGKQQDCHEFNAYSENLAIAAGSPTVADMHIEKAVYSWIYADASSSWGHRRATFAELQNNHGDVGDEGYIGAGYLRSSSYTVLGNFAQSMLLTFNFFDPVATGDCQYTVTLARSALPKPAGTNSANAANADTAATSVNTETNINILANDQFSDGVKKVEIIQAAKNGSVTVNPDNSLKYLPNSNYTGNDSFTYQVTDQKDVLAQAQVTVTINPADSTGSSGSTGSTGSTDNSGSSGGSTNNTNSTGNTSADTSSSGSSGGGAFSLLGLALLGYRGYRRRYNRRAVARQALKE